jgi:hypothetical protein
VEKKLADQEGVGDQETGVGRGRGFRRGRGGRGGRGPVRVSTPGGYCLQVVLIF